MIVGTRRPFDWLVIDCLPDQPTLLGAPQVIFGRAIYDGDGDLLTVTTLTPTGRLSETTQVGGHPMQPLAKMLLREMYRGGRITP